MVARGFREAWTVSSVGVKIGLIAAALVVLAVLVVSTKSCVQNRSYERKEAAEAAKRAADEDEKAQLRTERDKFKADANDANARADTYKQVAESKRTDRAATVKELEEVEKQHKQHQAEAEASGNTLSDAELRDELCKRLAARGYKACN